MGAEWGEWVELDEISPYFHWESEGSGVAPFGSLGENAGEDVAQPSASVKEGIRTDTSIMAIPPHAINEDYIPIAPNDTSLDIPTAPSAPADITPLEDDTIIAGVVDVGIPLGHNRWRFKDGKTRLLSAWQMMAPWALRSQTHLPFGVEFSQSEINTLLKKHSWGQQNGWLNEHDFNVETGLISMEHQHAQRGAAGHSSHGAHVLDVVAGIDPSEDEAFQKRVRIIAINAPTAAVFQGAGTHLDAYMFYAVQRISDIADAAWKAQNPNFKPTNNDGSKAVKGYPIVVNMSFGKQAGSKDALDEFPAKIAQFVKQRAKSGWSKIRFVMPSGNDNQDRCNAMLEPQKGAIEKLDWRILPEDHSANYVEIWGEDAGEVPIEISLKSPHSKARFLNLPTPVWKHQYRDLSQDGEPVARVYFSRITSAPTHEEGDDGKGKPLHAKYRYVLCTAPTHWAGNLQPANPTSEGAQIPPATAPSGLWEIAVKNLSNERVQCVLSVQTDQALSTPDGVNLRSYFDDEHYELFGADGAPLESYSFPPDSKNNVENQDIRAETPVRRHGTMNASTTHKVFARVGGYRVSDRRPAVYSATGRGRKSGKDDGTILGSKRGNGRRFAPTASFPTEDGPAHFGILAAGAANGSVAAMRGTSFASSQGARELIEQLVRSDSTKTASAMLRAKAKADERASTHPIKFASEQKEVLGRGRINRPDKQRISRF